MQLYYAVAIADWPSVVCMWMAARYRDGQTASLPVVPPAADAAISVTHASVRPSVGPWAGRIDRRPGRGYRARRPTVGRHRSPPASPPRPISIYNSPGGWRGAAPRMLRLLQPRRRRRRPRRQSQTTPSVRSW